MLQHKRHHDRSGSGRHRSRWYRPSCGFDPRVHIAIEAPIAEAPCWLGGRRTCDCRRHRAGRHWRGCSRRGTHDLSRTSPAVASATDLVGPAHRGTAEDGPPPARGRLDCPGWCLRRSEGETVGRMPKIPARTLGQTHTLKFTACNSEPSSRAMKLVLVGAGVRSPLFAAAALRRADRIGLDELWLMDIDRRAARTVRARSSQRDPDRPAAAVQAQNSTDADAGPRRRRPRRHHHPGRRGRWSGPRRADRPASRRPRAGDDRAGRIRDGPSQHPGHPRLRRAARPSQSQRLALLLHQPGRDGDAGAPRRRVRALDRDLRWRERRVEAVASFTGTTRVDELRADVFGLNHLSWARSVTRDGVDLSRACSRTTISGPSRPLDVRARPRPDARHVAQPVPLLLLLRRAGDRGRRSRWT